MARRGGETETVVEIDERIRIRIREKWREEEKVWTAGEVRSDCACSFLSLHPVSHSLHLARHLSQKHADTGTPPHWHTRSCTCILAISAQRFEPWAKPLLHKGADSIGLVEGLIGFPVATPRLHCGSLKPVNLYQKCGKLGSPTWTNPLDPHDQNVRSDRGGSSFPAPLVQTRQPQTPRHSTSLPTRHSTLPL